MTPLDPPRHPTVQQALDLSRELCRGHSIDGAPALRHAVLVARTLVDHVPAAAPDLIAAALLHDAPLFAPDDVDLQQLLHPIGHAVPGLVTAMHAEHQAMMGGADAVPPLPPLLHAMAADKIVAFRSLMRRARRSGDVTSFFAQRQTLRGLLPYFVQWIAFAEPHLPPDMNTEFAQAFTTVTRAFVLTGS